LIGRRFARFITRKSRATAVDAPVFTNDPALPSTVQPALSRRPAAAAASWSAIVRLLLRAIATLHCQLYRASDGRLGATVRGCPVLLLTTTGRRSRRSRTWPVCYLSAGDELILVASAGGAQRHPGWYLNLRTDPQVRICLAGRRQAMRAHTVVGVERARLWHCFVQHYPVTASYQHKTGRVIPVIVLAPVPRGVPQTRLRAA
jgi:deazaflavin-dependent oxidoreductase (nitroreductase family)